MTRQHTVRQTQAILTDAHTLAATIVDALRHLDDGTGGYKSGHDSNGTGGSTVERQAEAHETAPDIAAEALVTLLDAIRRAVGYLHTASAISQRWGTWAVGGADLRERLAAIDAGIWCQNCLPLGFKNPRSLKGTLCSFCAQFQTDFKRPAPREIIDIHVTYGRVHMNDILRILKRIDAERKEARRATKTGGKMSEPVAQRDGRPA